MATALIQWQFDLANDGTWVDLTERVDSPVTMREGLAIEQLGGPEADGRSSSLSLDLDNADGYFTTGMGSAYGPGSRIRLRWRAEAGDSWEVRYVGRLAESDIRFDNGSFIRTRWLSSLWLLKSGRIRERTVLDLNPVQILNELCDAAGIPTADRDFDADATLYGFLLPAGYGAVRTILAATDGLIWDDHLGRVRFELPNSRLTALVAQTYREMPGTDGLTVAPPRSLTRPFGVVNEVEAHVQVYTPAGQTGQQSSPSVPVTSFARSAPLGNEQVPVSLSFSAGRPLSSDAAITDYDLDFQLYATGFPQGPDYAEFTISHSSTSGSATTVVGAATLGLEVSGLSVSVSGSQITIAFNARSYREQSGLGQFALPDGFTGRVSGTVTVNDTDAFSDTFTTFEFSREDVSSIATYGYRPRQTPLIIVERSATPPGMTYTPQANVNAIMQTELNRYANPIPVLAVRYSSEDADRLDDILARRIGERVRLVADGLSELGIDAQFHIRSMETVIDPIGTLHRTMWLEESVNQPLPPPDPMDPDPMPMPIAAPQHEQTTRTSATMATISWHAVTGAVSYRVKRGTATGGPYTLLATVTAPTVMYMDNTLVDGTDYYYVVSAVDVNDIESANSDEGAAIQEVPQGFNWRLDALSDLQAYFTVPTGAGAWTGGTAPSTPTSGTGPSPNNADDFVHTERTGVTAADAAVSGRLVLDSNQLPLWAGHDVTFRYCAQWSFGQTNHGLSVQYRTAVGAGSWLQAGVLRAWDYGGSSARETGDSVTDYGNVQFTVAQDGGWRDATISIPANAAEIRLAPIYTGSPMSDIALHTISRA